MVQNNAWTASPNQVGAHFGSSVAAAGDVDGDGFDDVVVGAPDHESGQAGEGRAFVYVGSPVGLAAAAAWTAEPNRSGASFGASVAAAGDVDGDGFDDVIVGAPGYSNGQADEGAAYAYLGSGAGLSAGAAWTAESDAAGAEFGTSVGTAGDVNGDGYDDVVVGAPAYSNGQLGEGSAAVFLGSPGGLSALPAWADEGDDPYTWFGTSVASTDVDGDGYSDVVVGASGASNGQAYEGAAAMYLGGPGGLSAVASWTGESNDAGAYLGASMGSGDMDGDGYGDVVVGTWWSGARLYVGGLAGLSADPIWTGTAGSSVGSAGDMDGDGYDDVVVGDVGYTQPEFEEGGAFLYLGSASGPAAEPAWSRGSNQPNYSYYSASAGYGASVGTAGDVNGDGLWDVVIGAPGYDDPQVDEGRAYVYLGDQP